MDCVLCEVVTEFLYTNLKDIGLQGLNTDNTLALAL